MNQNIDPEDLQLRNTIWSFFGSNSIFFRNWYQHFVKDERWYDSFLKHRKNRDLWLRNKVGIIWICSLLDTVEGKVRFLEYCQTESKKHNKSNIIYTIKQLEVFFELVEEVLRRYKKEEQIFMTDMRNVYVHSWLYSKLSESVTIKYFDGENLIREKLPAKDYHSIVRERFLDPENNIEDQLSDLVNRFDDKSLNYWKVVKHLSKPGWLNLLSNALKRDLVVKINGIDV